MRFEKGDGVKIMECDHGIASGRVGVVVEENQSVFYPERQLLSVQVAGHDRPLTYYDSELIHSKNYYLDKFKDEVQRRG